MIDQLILEISQLLGQSGSLSKRYNSFWNYNRADNNIFASISTLFVLEGLKEYFSPVSLEKLNKIKEEVLSILPIYANKDGKPSFNFYPTKPSRHFQGGWLMHRFKHFKLPDDIDDSALVYMVGKFTIDQKIAFKNLAMEHKAFALRIEGNLKVYNTWFADKMPDEVDCCVLCNMLLFVFKNNLSLQEIDKNAITYLAGSVKYIESNTFWLSRHYGNIPLVVYHYARLMGSFDITELKAKQNDLIQIALRQLKLEKVFLNRILLETALIKLGLTREKITDIDIYNFEKDFCGFIGAPLAPYKTFRNLAKYSFGHICYSSSILNKAYLVEYLVLSKELI